MNIEQQGGAVSELQPGWVVREWQCDTNIPPELGAWLMDHKLFSRGNDFTAGISTIRADHVGVSVLRKLWMGENTVLTKGMAGCRLWVVCEADAPNVPRGVVAWLHTDVLGEATGVVQMDEVPRHPNHKPKQSIPTVPLGLVMTYMDPAFRKQGVIKSVMQRVAEQVERVAVTARKQEAFPVVSAEGGTAKMLEIFTDVPVVDEPVMCQSLRSRVWRFRTEADMWPEDAHRYERFLVDPVVIAQAQKTKVRSRRV